MVGSDLNLMAVIVFHQFFAVGEVTGTVAVGQNANLGLGQGLQRAFGGLDIGLTDIQVIYMDAALFGCIGIGNKFTNGRLRQF